MSSNSNQFRTVLICYIKSIMSYTERRIEQYQIRLDCMCCAPVHDDSLFLHSAWFIISLSPSVIFDSLCTFIPNWHNLLCCRLVRLVHNTQLRHGFSFRISIVSVNTNIQVPFVTQQSKTSKCDTKPPNYHSKGHHDYMSHTFKEDDNSEILGDVIKWKHFPRYQPFVRGIHRSHHKASDPRLCYFFDLRLNKRSRKQSRHRWFETP